MVTSGGDRLGRNYGKKKKQKLANMSQNRLQGVSMDPLQCEPSYMWSPLYNIN